MPRKVIKKILQINLVLLFLFPLACDDSSQQQIKDNKHKNEQIKTTVIEFEAKEFDFGTVTSGEHVSHRFKFKNTGNQNLYITKVEASCGCTVVNYTKEAVLPGQESFVEIVFDSSNYHGLQIKDITVYANTKPVENKLVVAATVNISE